MDLVHQDEIVATAQLIHGRYHLKLEWQSETPFGVLHERYCTNHALTST